MSSDLRLRHKVAVRLGLSPETVKTHIASMLAKLDLADRRQLTTWQPREKRERRHVLGTLSVPAGLAALQQPLVWAGVGVAGLVAVAVVTVVVAAGLEANDGRAAHPAARDVVHVYRGGGHGRWHAHHL